MKQHERHTHLDDERAGRMVKGHMDIMLRLRQQYIYEATPPLLEKLRMDISQKDAAALREHAHSLKGSSSIICAPRALALACALEQAAMGRDLLSAETMLTALDKELEILSGFVHKE